MTKAQITAAEFRQMQGGKKPSKPPNVPATLHAPVALIAEPSKPVALNTAKMWQPLQVYTCASAEPGFDRVVVPRCPEAHTAALKAHIESFTP